MNSGTFTIDDSVEIHTGDKVFIHIGDDETWTGTVTAPGEFVLDLPRWSFGTVVQSSRPLGDTRRLMVLSDNPSGGFLAIRVDPLGPYEVNDGHEPAPYIKSNWQPVAES